MGTHTCAVLGDGRCPGRARNFRIPRRSGRDKPSYGTGEFNDEHGAKRSFGQRNGCEIEVRNRTLTGEKLLTPFRGAPLYNDESQVKRVMVTIVLSW